MGMKINRSRYMLRKFQSRMTPVEGLSKKEIFKLIKPTLINEFESYLSTINVSTGLKKSSKRGAHRQYDLDGFFDILFAWLDNGFKYSHIAEVYKDKGAGSFSRYLARLEESGIVKRRWRLSSLSADKSQLFVIDSFTVKSIDGTECTGANYLDRGRRGTKVTLVTNTSKIITNILVTPANRAETFCLDDLLETKSIKSLTTLQSDRGYFSRKLVDKCKSRGIKLLVPPKALTARTKLRTYVCKSCQRQSPCSAPKTCSNNIEYLETLKTVPPTKYSHTLTTRETNLLQEHRNKIEHVNGEIRRFRAINLKCVRRIKYYTLLVTLGALLVNTFHNGFF